MFDYLGAFFVLLFLEVILGIDNIVFISIITSRIPNSHGVRYFGLGLALLLRLAMLFFVSVLLTLKAPIFYSFSLQDIIFLCGGAFLLFKGLSELVQDIKPKANSSVEVHSKFLVVFYIALVDLVFSIDSLLTAVAITRNMFLIGLVFIITIVFMAFSAESVSKWIKLFPEFKTLALLFIVSIGLVLILEGLHIDVAKGYLYFAFGFSLLVQLCNALRQRISSRCA